MTDTSPPTPTGSSRFCGECGAAIDADATFCGECGTAQLVDDEIVVDGDVDGEVVDDGDVDGEVVDDEAVDDEAADDEAVDDDQEPVAPTLVVERIPEPTIPPPPSPSGTATLAAPAVPPPTDDDGPGPEGSGGGSNRPKVLVALLVLVALVVGAFLFLGGDDGDDDAGDDDTSVDRDDDADDPDDDPDDDDADDTTTAPADSTTTAPTTTAADDGSGFVSLVDDTGRLTVEVPADWTDVELAADEGVPRILAAPDTDAFETGFEVPGLDLRLIESPPLPEQFDATLDTVADAIGLPGFCTSEGKQDYVEGDFTGRIEEWTECAGTGTQMSLLFARSDDGQTIFLGLQLTAADDPAIADRVASSVAVTG